MAAEPVTSGSSDLLECCSWARNSHDQNHADLGEVGVFETYNSCFNTYNSSFNTYNSSFNTYNSYFDAYNSSFNAYNNHFNTYNSSSNTYSSYLMLIIVL